MNNISFKAQLTGFNSEVKKTIFESLTKKDTKHEMVLISNPDTTECDKFELYKNGKKTAEHYADIDQDKMPVEKILKIFNLLKIKEAQSIVEEKRRKK